MYASTVLCYFPSYTAERNYLNNFLISYFTIYWCMVITAVTSDHINFNLINSEFISVV